MSVPQVSCLLDEIVVPAQEMSGSHTFCIFIISWQMKGDPQGEGAFLSPAFVGLQSHYQILVSLVFEILLVRELKAWTLKSCETKQSAGVDSCTFLVLLALP